MEHKINKIEFNWFYTPDGADWCSYVVGKQGVKEITEYSAAGEGDKWFYFIKFDDGKAERIFNPNRVYFN